MEEQRWGQAGRQPPASPVPPPALTAGASRHKRGPCLEEDI